MGPDAVRIFLPLIFIRESAVYEDLRKVLIKTCRSFMPVLLTRDFEWYRPAEATAQAIRIIRFSKEEAEVVITCPSIDSLFLFAENTVTCENDAFVIKNSTKFGLWRVDGSNILNLESRLSVLPGYGAVAIIRIYLSTGIC